ncbi:hypothetical protein WG617_01945 [Mycoplasmopsis felifaucium]|uniref:Uncharacterized protein n=1 Tax=Mycoplasmopsis felifaucium TaxID=35768 RepID=A0ABZ2RVF8_9BACT
MWLFSSITSLSSFAFLIASFRLFKASVNSATVLSLSTSLSFRALSRLLTISV